MDFPVDLTADCMHALYIMWPQVELKLKKAEGIQWTKLDERGARNSLFFAHCVYSALFSAPGTPPKAYNSYFQKWDLIPEKDVEP